MIASDVFVLNFFWKYVDYRINLIDLNYLKSVTPLNPKFKSILENYKYCFKNKNDFMNFHIILSQISEPKLEQFSKFYMNIIYKITGQYHTFHGINELIAFIDSEFKLKTLIVCLYYYF
mgnify:CR=1 FL=1|jgi:hypothetical protein